MPKRITAITKGWAENKAILVAVEADAHKMAKDNPATSHVYLLRVICIEVNA
jgi:hypothetical protein